MKSLTSGRLHVDCAGGLDARGQYRRGQEQMLDDHECAHVQDPMSLRCECSDINMPKPAKRVTIDVPP